MTDVVFCYHCRVHHPLNEVRKIRTKAGHRWRCIRSIAATTSALHEREEFGRQTTAFNKAVAASKKFRSLPLCLMERHPRPRHQRVAVETWIVLASDDGALSPW